VPAGSELRGPPGALFKPPVALGRRCPPVEQLDFAGRSRKSVPLAVRRQQLCPGLAPRAPGPRRPLNLGRGGLARGQRAAAASVQLVE